MGASHPCLTLEHPDLLHAKSCRRDVTVLSPSPHLCPTAEGLQPQAGSGQAPKGPETQGSQTSSSGFWRNKSVLIFFAKRKCVQEPRSPEGWGPSSWLCPICALELLPLSRHSRNADKVVTPRLHTGSGADWYWNLKKTWKIKICGKKPQQSELWYCNLSQLLLSYNGPWARMAGVLQGRMTPLGLWFMPERCCYMPYPPALLLCISDAGAWFIT